MKKYSPPQKNAESSTVSFFFLVLYTIAVFARPQDWTYEPIAIPTVGLFLVLSFTSYLLLHPNKVFHLQTGILLGIIITIFFSLTTNGWITGGINRSFSFAFYSFIPYIVFSSILNTTFRLKVILQIIIMSSMLMLLNGISQTLSFDGKGWAGSYAIGTRITYVGMFEDPNDLAMIFVMTIPFAFVFLKTTQSVILRLLYLGVIFGLVYGLFLTNSRGGILGLLSLILVSIYFKYGKIKAGFITLIAVPLGMFALSFFRTIDANENSAHGRIEAWYTGVQMLKSNLLFGVGKGNFLEYHYLTAHNSYVLIMAELGTIGYILWVSLLMSTGYMLNQVLQLKEKDTTENSLLTCQIYMAKAFFYSLIAYATTAFFLSRSYVVFLYVFLGMCTALVANVERDTPTLKEKISKVNIMKIFLYSAASLIGLYMVIVILI